MSQNEFNFEAHQPKQDPSSDFDEASLRDFLKGGSWPLQTQFKAFILAWSTGKEGLAEDFRKGAERFYGYSLGSVAGSVCLQLESEGYLIRTGERRAPRDPKSHGSKNDVWRRTNKPWKYK